MTKVRDDMKKLPQTNKKVLSEFHYFHGNIFFQMKQFQKAYALYIEAIKANPQNGAAYNNLAIIFHMGKKHQEALKYLNEAEKNGVKVNPKLKASIEKALNK